MAIFTVTTSLDVVAGGDGVLSLREAVQQANAAAGSDTILFAGSLESTTLTLTQGQLTLQGDTIVDGDRDDNGSQVTISGGGASRVLAVEAAATLRDLTIADGRTPEEAGAGVMVTGRLTMAGCTVTNCYAGDNTASFANGGGIYMAAGTRLDLSSSRVVGNKVYGSGGGIYAGPRSYVTVAGCTIDGNGALSGGGMTAAGYTEVRRTSFRGNGLYTYNNDDGRGGGLLVTGITASATVEQSLVAYNSAPDGGGVYVDEGRITLRHSTIANNGASGDEFPGATAGISGNAVVLERCTVTGNGTSNDGFIYAAAAGVEANNLRISDSLILGNYNRYGPSDVGGSIAFSNGRNILGDTPAGSVPGDLVNVDPARVFAAIDARTGGGLLALNGGPTATVALRDALDNPALNAGEPAVGQDQRGVTSPQPVGTNPDLGAFELAQAAVSTTAGARNDVLTGTAAADTIAGLAGADLIGGLGGADTLLGHDGSDTLYGDAGNDLLEGGLGSDWIVGGAGADRVSFFNDASPLGVSVNLRLEQATRGGELDRLIEVENVDGTNRADSIVGDEEANRLNGAGGDDRLNGGYRDDILNGGLGNDVLNGFDDWDRIDTDLVDYSLGGAVVVDLSGTVDRGTRETEVDRLIEIEGAIGSAKADTFRGDDAANLFRGLGGRDVQTGGAGADSFDYDALSDSRAGASRDRITDFAHLADRLDLSTIDARTATPAVNDAFTFLAARGAAFTAAGQVRWYHADGDTIVEANVDANLAPDLQLQLDGLRTLTGVDFVL